MLPGQNNLSDPQMDLYKKASREWIDLSPYLGSYIQFPDPTQVLNKPNLAEAGATINRYPTIAMRVNSDGMVLMRGLLRTATNINIATGQVVATLPRWLIPRYPQQLRFHGLNAALSLDSVTGELKIDIVYFATTWINVGHVIYYID